MKRATSVLPEIKRMLEISIHALVKRATGKGRPLIFLVFISIHALVKRATLRFIVCALR